MMLNVGYSACLYFASYICTLYILERRHVRIEQIKPLSQARSHQPVLSIPFHWPRQAHAQPPQSHYICTHDSHRHQKLVRLPGSSPSSSPTSLRPGIGVYKYLQVSFAVIPAEQACRSFRLCLLARSRSDRRSVVDSD